MNEPKLGTVPQGDEGRDAVHVAIVPVMAAEEIPVGQFVRLNDSGQAICCDYGSAIGVADPFAKEPPKKAAWFWLCLFPKTIKGLRHVWEHPAFVPEQPGQIASGEKQESLAWLRDYLVHHCPCWHNEADKGVAEFLRRVERDRHIFYYGTTCHGLHDVEDADELFSHLSIILNRRITASYFEAFTCSC